LSLVLPPPPNRFCPSRQGPSEIFDAPSKNWTRRRNFRRRVVIYGKPSENWTGRSYFRQGVVVLDTPSENPAARRKIGRAAVISGGVP
jgi:hypothetical protein